MSDYTTRMLGLPVLSGRDVRNIRRRVLAHKFTDGDQTPPKPPKPPTLNQDPPPNDEPPKGDNMGMYGDTSERNPSAAGIALTIIGVVFALIVFILALMFGVPKWRVWQSELQGKAEFVRAEQNRLIQIEEAKANLEAEKLNAQAEIERAKGAAAAIEIEGGKLTDAYLRYLWIRQLKSDRSTLIYIPTEAGLPVLEAGRCTSLPQPPSK